MAQEIKPTQPASGRVVDPFSDMRSEMDRMFEGMFGRPWGRPFSPLSMRLAEPMLTPSIDVKETDQAVTISAELPGLSEEDVNVTVRDGLLTLKGEKKSEIDETRENVHISERSYGSFMRSFRLPDTVDDEKVSASFDKGVLTITLPKSENAKPERKIEIRRG